jgi:hypothetical protein
MPNIIDHSAKLNKWIDDNTNFLDVGSSGSISVIESGEVESKMTELAEALVDAIKVIEALHYNKELYSDTYFNFNEKVKKLGFKQCE